MAASDQRRHPLFLLFFVLSVLLSVCNCCIQLPSCNCTMVGSSKRQRGRKIDCSQHPAPFKTLVGKSFPPDTVHLNLAHNALVALRQGSFIHFSSLQKLNLSSNQITIIEPGAFDGLKSLKKLDLSNNLIGTINSSMFSGLPNLEKLFFSNNRISTIPDGTFNYLPSLKRIELQSNYLRCDCHLKWILKWIKTRHVRIPSSTTCALPAKMRNKPLSKLKRRDLHCDHSVQLLTFNIRPSESQLVFKGDKLPFECHASYMPGDMSIAWFRSGHLVTTNKTMGVFVHTSHNLDRTIIIHRLVVESLDTTHAGEWSCVVSTSSGNLTKTVHVEVRMPDVVLQCPTVTNKTSKGMFTWEESMAGLLVSQPCEKAAEAGAMATHKCGVDGHWRDLNVSACSFVRDVTRKLARLAKMDSGAVDIPTLMYDVRKALAAAEKQGEQMDSFDTYFVSRIMATLLPHAAENIKICSLLLNMASNVSALPQHVVDLAQLETRAPLRIVKMVEKMGRTMNTKRVYNRWRQQTRNIVMVILDRGELEKEGMECAAVAHNNGEVAGFTCGPHLMPQNFAVHLSIPRKSRLEAQIDEEEELGKDGSPPVLTSDAPGNNTDVSGNEDNITLYNSTSLGNDSAFILPPESYPSSSVDSPSSSVDSLSSSAISPTDQPSADDSDNPSAPLGIFPPQAINLTSKHFLNFPSLNLSSKDLLQPFARRFGALTATTSAVPPPPSNAYVILFRNGHLFPVIKSDLSDPAFQKGTWAIVTPVIAISLGRPAKNLSEPVVITFDVADIHRPLKAAYFDFKAIDGYGGWKTDGCEIVQQNGSTVTVHVHHLSHFALLQEISFAYRLAAFPMEPVIYVGSGVCMLCLIFVITTLIACFGAIGIPKKVKHAVVNICLSTLLLMTGFVCGINRTDVELPCQISGICIHYLTLCAVFWITITSNIIYKKFIKANRPPEPPPDPIVMPLPPKPILQFYFVGYGVPLIICGITAAVNLNFYAGIQYCFLEWEPSLGAFYAPVALLVAWNLILFLRISCVVRSVPENDSDAANESDNEIHANEIELVPSQPDTTTTTAAHNGHSNNNYSGGYRRRYSHHSNDDEEDSVSTVSLPDQERRPITQLRSLVAILFLFIVMWMCAALAIAKPFHHIIPHQELIFSYIYGLMSALFGIFMITFFCFTRKDSCLTWKRAVGMAPPEVYTPPMEVTETILASPPPPTPAAPQANGSAVKSNSNTNLSVYSQKSSNITKAYNMKNNSNKQSNINLILPNSSEISFGSTQDSYPNFYNPRQNGAAKKFWQKNRQHSKIMNKDVNRDLNSSMTDNNSGGELNHHSLSRGTSSDGNTHLSIEIQIQAKDRHGSKPGTYSGSREIPVHMAHTQNKLGSSCGAISIEHNQMVGLTPEGAATAGVSQSPCNNNEGGPAASELSSLPQQHERSPSAGSLGGGVHPSAFTPVQPRSNVFGQKNKPQEDSGGESGGQPRARGSREGSAAREESVKNQLNGSVNQNWNGELQGQVGEMGQRPVNPGVAWSPFHCNLPPLPSHPPTTYSLNQPPPPYPHQQHYPFDYSSGYPCPAMLPPVNPHLYNLNQQSRSPLPPHSMSPTPFNPSLPPQPPAPSQPAAPSAFNIPPSPYLVQTQSRGLVKSMSPVSSSSHSQAHSARQRRSSGGNGWRPLSGGDSSDSSRPRQKRAHSGGSPGRSVTYAPRSPVLSDSQAYESRYQVPTHNGQPGAKQARSMDSDHHSDPTHRKKHQRSDRQSRNKLTTKQRSLGWEDQFRNRTPKVNYVYVNHMYKDKVMHKLIKQASESDDLAKKAFWLPRSASEYDRLTQKGFCNMAEDTSSSSEDEDSLDNVWIRQSSGSDFRKKETSV